MGWTHQFDEEFAVKNGVIAAVVFEKIRFWIRHNAATGQNLIDGKTWTYNTKKAWQAELPFFSEKQVRDALDRLIERGYLVAAHHSPQAWDRTLWYALADESEVEMHRPQGANENGPGGDDASAPQGQSSTAIRPQDNELPEHPVAAAPGRKRSDHEVMVFKTLGDITVKREGVWAKGKKEATCLWDMIDDSKKRYPDSWEHHLGLVFGLAWNLRQGNVSGLSKSDKGWWMRMPFTPSAVWGRIEQIRVLLTPGTSPAETAEAQKEEATRMIAAARQKAGLTA